MASGVRDRDLGMARFLVAIQDLERPRRMTVGVHEDDGAKDHPGHGKVIDVAAAQ